MKKKYVILISIFLSIIILAILTHKKTEKFINIKLNGKAEIPVSEYNYGKISYSDTINYTFKIKNVGNVPLVINKVLPNCNCTLINYNKNIIPVKDSMEIKAQFIPKKNNLGENSASILVEGNFNNGVTELKLKGFVENSR